MLSLVSFSHLQPRHSLIYVQLMTRTREDAQQWKHIIAREGFARSMSMRHRQKPVPKLRAAERGVACSSGSL